MHCNATQRVNGLSLIAVNLLTYYYTNEIE